MGWNDVLNSGRSIIGRHPCAALTAFHHTGTRPQRVETGSRPASAKRTMSTVVVGAML